MKRSNDKKNNQTKMFYLNDFFCEIRTKLFIYKFEIL